ALAQVEGAVPPADLFRALHRALPASSSIVDEIVSEITQMKQFLFESRPFRQYRGWTGALGTGLGTALGVKLARPGDTVVCVLGDGAFHYNPVPAALGFAQQYETPLLIVVCDNRGYTSQTWNVHKYFADGAAVRSGQFFGDVLTPTPDYVKLAEAYGGTGQPGGRGRSVGRQREPAGGSAGVGGGDGRPGGAWHGCHPADAALADGVAPGATGSARGDGRHRARGGGLRAGGRFPPLAAALGQL